MPSRRKKELRDSALTNTFFDQHDSGDSGGDIHLCAYCPAHAHLCASASMRVSAEDLNTETFRLRMTNLWRERLNDVSAGDLGRVGTAVRGQLEIDSPRNVLQALRHAHEHMGNVPATAADDESTRMETFDLGNLEKVAETYDELCEKHEDEKLSEIFRLVTLGEGFKAAAKNTTRSAKDRLAKKLEIPNIVIQCKTTVQLTSCLRQAQLFNVEKRFGFEEESYKALSNGDKEESPQSFGQRLNDPFQPLVSLSKPRKKKEKKTLGSLEALNQLTRNCKLAVKDMQDLKKTFSGAEEPHTELSNLKARLKYADTPVPKDLPVHVRQWFSDAETAYLEILSLQKEAYKQLLYVKSAFVAWSSASLEVWNAGVERIHELPLLREYEHTRNALHAMFFTASRQELKIVEWYSSHESLKLPQAVSEVFRLGSMSLKEFEKDWETRCLQLKAKFPPVEDIMAGIDEEHEEAPKADRPKTEWWRHVLRDAL